MGFGITALRATLGAVFIAHGLQKARGWFGGPGPEGTEGMMAATGMHPPRVNARLVTAAETAGGAALIAGAATPVASAALISTMLVAIRKVHWRNGFFSTGGGWEFNAVLIASAFAVTAEGPGRLSLDALVLRKSRWGAGVAALSLAAGVIGSLVAVESGRRFAPPAPPTEDAGES